MEGEGSILLIFAKKLEKPTLREYLAMKTASFQSASVETITRDTNFTLEKKLKRFAKVDFWPDVPDLPFPGAPCIVPILLSPSAEVTIIYKVFSFLNGLRYRQTDFTNG